MWPSSFRTNNKNNALIHKLVLGFIFSTLIAYITSFIYNYVIYQSQPIVERWIVWNAIFFILSLGYAKFIVKPLSYRGRKRYRLEVLLEHSKVIQIMKVSIVAQYFVFFTPKGFFLYLFIPIYNIILWILNKVSEKRRADSKTKKKKEVD